MPPRSDPGTDTGRIWPALIATAGLLVVAVAVILFAIVFPRAIVSHKNAWGERVAAMTDDLKAQLELWGKERLADAEVVASFPSTQALFAPAAAGKVAAGEHHDDHLVDVLSEVSHAHNLSGVYVIDTVGNVKVRTPGSRDLDEECRTAAGLAVARGEGFVDFHAHANGTVVLAVSAPIVDRSLPRGAPALGAVVMAVDPNEWVFPLLAAFPLQTASGEAYLVRRDGDSIVFLSPLRHRPGPPLSLRQSVGPDPVAAATAVDGLVHADRVLDYRGVEVVAATRRIAGTRWGLVGKIDRAEVMHDYVAWRRNTLIYAVLALSALAGVGYGMWRQSQVRLLRKLADSQTERAEILDRVKEEIRTANERFRALFDASPAAIIAISTDGKVTLWNRSAETIFGWRAEEVIGQDLPIVPPDTREESRKLMARVRAGEAIAGVELARRRIDGSTVLVRLSSAPMHGPTGEVDEIMAIAEDVTERARMDEHLRQAQKLESVGRLAGGVAHDFNNLLQVILAEAQMLEISVGDNEGARALLKDLHEQVKRAAALTRQLLIFSRRETTRLEVVDLNAVVRDGAAFLRRLVRENVTMTVEPADAPLQVEADTGQLEQILMNLAVNASDAMPAGGRLTMRTRTGDAGEAVLEVSDTGHGIPEAIRGEIFDPFFTTKEAGKGTGLGLSVVHGIVTKHRGWIEVESQPGHGTTFRTHLPQVARPAGSDRPPSGEQALAVGKGEHILVIEDDETTRQMFCRVLERAGYRATGAGSAREVGLVADTPAVEVLLTDLILPDAVGIDLAATLSQRWPALRVVLMSGYAPDDVTRERLGSTTATFLQKPIELPTLLRTIRETLDGDGAGKS